MNHIKHATMSQQKAMDCAQLVNNGSSLAEIPGYAIWATLHTYQ